MRIKILILGLFLASLSLFTLVENTYAGPKVCVCSANCGGGILQCIDLANGKFTNEGPCNTQPCTGCVNTSWSCGSCSKSCGGGFQYCTSNCGETGTFGCNSQPCGDPPPRCGDGSCRPGVEYCSTCPQDCGTCPPPPTPPPTPSPTPGVYTINETCNSSGTGWDITNTVCRRTCVAASPTPDCNSGRACGSCGVACGNGLRQCTYNSYSGGGNCNPVSFTEPCSRICPPGQSCVANACQSNYTISGNVFIDENGNTLKDAGEQNYTGSITVNSTGGSVDTPPGTGTFTVNNLFSGSYTVSYSNLPSGYSMTYPLNGPPPSFTVTVGSSCSTGGSNSANCTGGSIINLNYGINNNRPWFQCQGQDCRIDSGFISKVPTTAVGGAYASIAGSGGTPGLIFSGSSSPDFGQGQASSTGWVAGGLSYPENYSPIRVGGQVKTSYNFLAARAAQGNITIGDISTYCTGGLSNCTLSASIPHGIYRANGNLSLNAFNFPTNQDYVILVNGDLTINGRITVPVGSTAIFSATGNITVDRNVGEAASSSSPTIQGIYSADRSFIVSGINNCATGADLRLNVAGTVITNAGAIGGSFQNNRDLCAQDPFYPTVQFQERADFILNTPNFLKVPNFTYQEIAP